MEEKEPALSFYKDLRHVYMHGMVILRVLLHLKRLIGVKREVGASLFLPPVVCQEGVTDYV